MTDLNMMMREQAKSGLEAKLAEAVTNGDTDAATKAADDLAKLAVATAPKAPPYGDAEIRAELGKLDWFGVDPKKSARVLELGKHMDPKKFSTAEAFAAALVKSVDEEFKPAQKPGASGDDTDEETDGDDTDEETDDKNKVAAKPRRTDAPGEGEANQRSGTRRTSGPWAKLTDAPADVQKEIKRSADKFLSANVPKEQRETFVKNALESHYKIHQSKGKK